MFRQDSTKPSWGCILISGTLWDISEIWGSIFKQCKWKHILVIWCDTSGQVAIFTEQASLSWSSTRVGVLLRMHWHSLGVWMNLSCKTSPKQMYVLLGEGYFHVKDPMQYLMGGFGWYVSIPSALSPGHMKCKVPTSKKMFSQGLFS